MTEAERMATDWAARKTARDEVMDRLWAAGYRFDGPTPPVNWHDLLVAAERRDATEGRR